MHIIILQNFARISYIQEVKNSTSGVALHFKLYIQDLYNSKFIK
jgi:hypothetical protein